MVTITPIPANACGTFAHIFQRTQTYLESPVASTYLINREEPVFGPLAKLTEEDYVLCVNIYDSEAYRECVDNWASFSFFTELSVNNCHKHSLFSIGSAVSGRTHWLNIDTSDRTMVMWNYLNNSFETGMLNILLVGGFEVLLYRFPFPKEKIEQHFATNFEARDYWQSNRDYLSEEHAHWKSPRFLGPKFHYISTPFFTFSWNEPQSENGIISLQPCPFEIKT